jgi:Arc/MetJ family transcription regulator
VARPKSLLRAAFLLPANLVGLATAGASALLTGEPLPALVALGVEGLYLGVASGSRRFQRALGARAEAEDEGQLTTLLSELSPSQRQQYQGLRELRDRILANYRKLPGGRVMVASSEGRLDALLTSFVRLLGSLNSYRTFLGGATRHTVERELRELEREVESEANPRVRDVKARRVDILKKRVERFLLAEESREVVAHQLAAIEDLLRLTHDQSISIRDPEVATRQLDALSAGVEASEETVREMERIMDFTEESGGATVSHGTRVR